jgi:nicotinamidase-related amidase
MLALLLLTLAPAGRADQGPAGNSNLPLRLRRLVEASPGTGRWIETETGAVWDAAKTAVVICDMWNQHWCKGATSRVAEMAPRMNNVVAALRDRGVLVIHCPSDTMKYYKDHPGRKLALAAPKVATTKPLDWVNRVAETEPALPIDDSDGGCDDQPKCPGGSPWIHEISTLEIKPGDAIADGPEAFYLMRQRGVTNVIVMGVHENMCVLGRPFSIRQMVRQGQNVVLMRDLTDTMYNSRSKPFVDHFTGTALVCWHIEKYWCPTITSDQIVGGQPFHFAADLKTERQYARDGGGK